MLFFIEIQICYVFFFLDLIDVLVDMFCIGCVMLVCYYYDMEMCGELDVIMLLMLVWMLGGFVGVKVVNVVFGNVECGLLVVFVQYLFLDVWIGEMLVLIDGCELMVWWIVVVLVLVVCYFVWFDVSYLFVVGIGCLVFNLIVVYMVVCFICVVIIWGWLMEKVVEFVCEVGVIYLVKVIVVLRLMEVFGQVDIVSVVILFSVLFIMGDVVKLGIYVDLVGVFKLIMCESDDVFVKCVELFVDMCDGCLNEGGDIVQLLNFGLIVFEDIWVDFYDFCKGIYLGWMDDEVVIMFKLVGVVLEDLVGVMFVYCIVDY